MAAGLGFKDFATGEVLTAADVDGYLMQGIWVFASNAARDAAVTAPAEGNFAFTKDTNSLWYYDGAAWVASGATGDIEGVTAGIGISGGGTSGTVTVTNSMATAIDAKGDLIGGTGADTFARLAVGANDTVLTADSSTATGLKWATPASGSTFVGVQVKRTTGFTASNNTTTVITYDSETFDTNSFHDNSTNPSRLTIPSGKTGYYFIYANTLTGQYTSGSVQGYIRKNGAATDLLAAIAGFGGYVMVQVIGVLYLTAGDYIESFIFVDGGNKDVHEYNGSTSFGTYYLGA